MSSAYDTGFEDGSSEESFQLGNLSSVIAPNPTTPSPIVSNPTSPSYLDLDSAVDTAEEEEIPEEGPDESFSPVKVFKLLEGLDDSGYRDLSVPDEEGSFEVRNMNTEMSESEVATEDTSWLGSTCTNENMDDVEEGDRLPLEIYPIESLCKNADDTTVEELEGEDSDFSQSNGYSPAQSDGEEDMDTDTEKTPATESLTTKQNKTYRQDDDYGWKTNDNDFVEPPDFTGDAGIKVDLRDNPSVLETFGLYFDKQWFRLIKHETNRYAREQGAKDWKPVHYNDMYRFFAMVCHICLVKKPSLADYFSTNEIYNSDFPRHIGMSRNRFTEILRYLHVSKNRNQISRGEDGYDALHKVRPVFDHFQNKVRTCYYPGQMLTIDEGLCPFKGKIHFRVYMKDKPHRYGIRFECVCESATGVIVNVEIYAGKDSGDENSVNSLVTRLVEPFVGKQHELYMDRRYSSPALFNKLLDLGFLPVGTVIRNRKSMPKAFQQDLKRGEMIFRRRDRLLAVKWKEQRDVYMLSCKDKANFDRTDINGAKISDCTPAKKPSAVLSYNANKVGVDRYNQMLAYYSFGRRSVKWWKKVFFHVFMMGLVNSQKIYNLRSTKKISLSDYIAEVGKALTLKSRHYQKKIARVQISRDLGSALCRNPFPEKIPATGLRHKPCRRCAWCCKQV